MTDGPPGPTPPPPGEPERPGWGDPGTPPPPSGQPPPPPQWGQPAQPSYGGYAQSRPTEGTAIAALVLAIASFVVCPVVPAIVALVIAGKAKENIARSQGGLTGESLVQVATIVSWVNIGLAVVGVLLIVVLALVGSSTNSGDALGAMLAVPS